MAKKQIPKERLLKDLKTKEVYQYVDEEMGFKVKSRELFKKRRLERHYPFNSRNGAPKYSTITSIVYEDVLPKNVRGVNKEARRGYGFTRNLSPMANYLSDHHKKINTVIISKKKPSELKSTQIIFNVNDLDNIFKTIQPIRDKHTGELRATANTLLAALFPSIKSQAIAYNKGELSSLVRQKDITAEKLSAADIDALADLIEGVDVEHPLFKKQRVLTTKNAVDKIYIETVLNDFDKRIRQKNLTKNLEARWHKFFKEHSWIFSHFFSYPAVFFEDEAYVGGKNISGVGGKYVDFLYKNKFSNSLAIIEIKTHKTELLEKKAYRGKDVFSVTKALSGAINQVLDQRDNLNKEFSVLTKGANVESFDPDCIVLIGKISELSKKQMKSFELFRRNSRDVHIITFDELHQRIISVLDVFKKAS